MKTKMKRKNLRVKKIKLTLIPVLLMMLIICGQPLSAQATWEGTEVTGTVFSSEYPGVHDWPDPVAAISFTDVEFLGVLTNVTTSADFTEENTLILTYENTSLFSNITYPPLTYTFELQGVSISDVSLVNSTFSSEIVSSFTSNSITLEVPLQNTNPGESFTATFAIVPEPPCGLVSKWPGDGDADDIVGGNHGTLVNGATFAPGLVNQAFSFDGEDDYVEVADTTDFNFNHPLTVSAWLLLDDNTNGGIIGQWGYGGEAGDAFMLSLDASHLRGTLPIPGLYHLHSTSEIGISKWTHVAMVYDGSVLELYVDGALDASGSILADPVVFSQTIKIGLEDIFFGGKHYLDGLIDEVAIWNCALDADEILAIFLASAAEAATEDLIEDIEEMDLPEGIENSLVSKLENAIKSMEKGQDNAAAKQLNAFIKQVKAQSGKKITKKQANALIAAAQEIIDLL